MAIVGQTSCKGRSIVESVRFAALRKLNLSLESFDLFPSMQDCLLFFWEVDGHDAQTLRNILRAKAVAYCTNLESMCNVSQARQGSGKRLQISRYPRTSTTGDVAKKRILPKYQSRKSIGKIKTFKVHLMLIFLHALKSTMESIRITGSISLQRVLPYVSLSSSASSSSSLLSTSSSETASP